MNKRKILAIFVAVAMVFGSFAPAFADTAEADTAAVDTETVDAAATVAEKKSAAFTDTAGHWGEAAIEKWAGYEIIKGYEGLFRPEDPITRGEMAVILDNMMDYQKAASNSFTDLQAGQFYTDAVLKANMAGIIKGDGKTVRPTDKITKEEAAVMFSRAFAVAEVSSTKAFTDASAVSSWAKGAVFGLEAKGYVSGYGGAFNPKASITRAETVTIINNIIKAYYTAAGTYTDNVAGSAVIKAAGVVIKDAVIDGDVIIAEGVADGNVTFDGKATVKGDLIVRGGGVNSIIITGSANIKSVVVAKVDGKVRIFADGVVIGEVEANEEVILEGTFTNVTVAADAAVTIKGNVTKLDLAEKAAVDIQSGTVSTLNIPAGATANIAASATVKTANVTGTAEIKGTGKIENAVISGTGATIAQTPAKVEVKEGGSANVGGKTVDNKTNPATPGTGGGGGGGGGGGNDTPATPSLSIAGMTVESEGTMSITPNEDGVYVIPWQASTTNSAVDVTITNTADVTYTAEISIKNGSREVAYASASGINKTYIDLLSAEGAVTFNDIGRMFDRLGTAHSGWYLDSNADRVEGNDETAFRSAIDAMFGRMHTYPPEFYTVTVTLTPAGGSAGSIEFKIGLQ
ncbi:MAG: S-layer homology domain-containing protein [Eubacteriales bacterium]|nr:S-layer homology domain-containing protein [Eubacteriales bacterium]